MRTNRHPCAHMWLRLRPVSCSRQWRNQAPTTPDNAVKKTRYRPPTRPVQLPNCNLSFKLILNLLSRPTAKPSSLCIAHILGQPRKMPRQFGSRFAQTPLPLSCRGPKLLLRASTWCPRPHPFVRCLVLIEPSPPKLEPTATRSVKVNVPVLADHWLQIPL